jgi:hypothetical protein
MSAPRIIDSDQLQAYLWQAGYETGTWSVADRSYAMPTRQFLTGAFAAALFSFLQFFNLLKWIEEAHDCDDFARLAAAFAQILHVLTPGRPPATALALGEFWYVQDSGGAHAINLAVIDEEVVAYEPQTRRVVQLSATEKRSGMHTRF